MKNNFKAMLLSASALAFVASPAATISIFAQTTTATPAAATPAANAQCPVDVRDKLYNDVILPNVSTKAKPTTPEQQKIAYDAAKDYLSKYDAPNCTDNAQYVTYLKKMITSYDARADAAGKEALIKEFNDAVSSGDPAKIFPAGKKMLAANMNTLTVQMFLVDTGFVAAQKNVDTYNADALVYAKQTLESINSGKEPETKAWNPFKTKDDASAWLNYETGYIYAFRQKDKKQAAPYFYQATKFTSPDISPSHVPYQAIGDAYLDQYTAAAEAYNKIKDDAAVDEAKKNEAAGTWKAYADRALEAYGLAYAKAKANTKNKPEVTKEINEVLTQLYKLRHSNEVTGMDAYVASLNGKPITDPATPIVPVVEATPAAAATTSSTATVTAPATTGAAATPGKTPAAATTKAADASAATAVKPAATPKKPVPAPKKDNKK